MGALMGLPVHAINTGLELVILRPQSVGLPFFGLGFDLEPTTDPHRFGV